MYRGHTTAVVIPAYNEAGFVGDTIESVPAFVDRIYVVEDGSTDDTWREIRETASAVNEAKSGQFPERVVPIRHQQNRGVGGAIKTGYLRARDERIDVTAVMGGDGQMDPEILGNLFDPILDGRADYTKGNRLLGRTDRGDMPRFRFVGNAILAALTKIASGYWANGDSQSGYTAISLRALEETDIESMYEFYGYCNDILVKLNVAGMRVLDVPRPITYGDEDSHIKYHTYIPRVSLMLARNFLWRLKTNYLVFDFHPLVGAYAAGGVASLVAVFAGVWALPGVGQFGTSIARAGFAVAFGLLGLLSFVVAMVLDAAANDELCDAERRVYSSPTGTEPAGDSYAPASQRNTPAVDADPGTGASREGTVAVPLDPREWRYVLDADPDEEPSALAARIRERIREHRQQADTAAD